MRKIICNSRFIAFGDSITAGSVVPPNCHNWTDIVGSRFGLKMINAGVGGNTSSQGLERIQADVIDKRPDFVTVCFGMNDHCMTENGTPKVTLGQFEQNLVMMVEKIQGAGAVPILMTTNYIIEGDEKEYYYSRHDRSFYAEVGGAMAWLDRYIQLVRDIAEKKGVGLIDVRKACEQYDPYNFLRTLRNCDAADGVHPHKLGVQVYADTLISFLIEHYM